MKVFANCRSCHVRSYARMFSIVTLIVFFSSLLSVSANAQDSVVDDIFEPGLREFNSGNYETVIKLLPGAINTALGCEHLISVTTMDDPLIAITHLRFHTDEALCKSINKENLWDAYFSLAVSYHHEKNERAFREEIKHAKSLNPSRCPNPETYSAEIIDAFENETCKRPKSDLQKAIEDYESGSYAAAIAKFSDVISGGVESGTDQMWEAHFHKGMSHYLQGDNKLAFKEWIAAINSDGERLPNREIFSREIETLYVSCLLCRIKKIEDKEKIWQKEQLTRAKCIEKFGNPDCIEDGGMKWYHYVGIAAVIGAAGGGGGGGGGGEPSVPGTNETINITW